MFNIDEVTIVIMGNKCLSQAQKNKEKKITNIHKFGKIFLGHVASTKSCYVQVSHFYQGNI